MSERIIRRIFDVIDEGLIVIHPDGRITYANPAAERILGLTKSEIQARDYVSPDWEILRPDGTPMPAEEMAGPRAMATQQTVRNVVMGVKRGDGSLSWINVNATPLFTSRGEFEGIAGVFTDITRLVHAEEDLKQHAKYLKEVVERQTEELLEANRRLQEAVRTDGLTGVKSRRGFLESAELLIRVAARQGHPVTVAYLDVDGLKVINDMLGHHEGDRLLAAVGAVLSSTFRSSDVVGRMGGDEFGAVVVGTPFSRSKALFRRLHAKLSGAIRDRGWKSGVSIGAIAFSEAPADLDRALKAADALMYRAKRKIADRMIYVESEELDEASRTER